MPAAYQTLAAVPEALLHHGAWPQRHPRTLYTLSSRKVVDSLGLVLKELERETAHFRSTGKQSDYGALLAAQKALVYTIREHIDDCYSILLSFTDPPTDRSEASRPERYLKIRQLPGLRRFEVTLRDYLVDHLAPLVNGLKHRAAILHPVIQWDVRDLTSARLGYYLEEVSEGELTGPSWRVHRDGNSGFSFSRDLRFHVYYHYELSQRLADVIRAICRAWHHLELPDDAVPTSDGRWFNTLKELTALPYEPLSNELTWPTPVLTLRSTDTLTPVFVAEYPVRRTHVWRIGELRVQAGATAGRGGTMLKLPYMGKPRRPKLG